MVEYTSLHILIEKIILMKKINFSISKIKLYRLKIKFKEDLKKFS